MTTTTRSQGFLAAVGLGLLLPAAGAVLGLAPDEGEGEGGGSGGLVVFSYADLGMHCMNEDFSEIAILPPFNNLRAMVLARGEEPNIVTQGITVDYAIPTNTHSADKTNFWKYAEAIFGSHLPPNVGLTGNGLSGAMTPAPLKQFEATGIPITPIDDNGRANPYPIAVVTARNTAGETAETRPVVPVSSELSCHLCHQSEGVTVATDILRAHDDLHGTSLEQQKPVLCANCHADNALGKPGIPGLPNLSRAMHSAHAPRMDLVDLDNTCYACHPGIRTQCQRDLHLTAGIECVDCHGGMNDVGNPAREPWIDLPTCGSCHSRPGFQFEQPGKLFKDSIGHGGVACAACHGSPHAITPTPTAADNRQAIMKQGHAGVIDTCTVCHTQQPDESFFHRVNH